MDKSRIKEGFNRFKYRLISVEIEIHSGSPSTSRNEEPNSHGRAPCDCPRSGNKQMVSAFHFHGGFLNAENIGEIRPTDAGRVPDFQKSFTHVPEGRHHIPLKGLFLCSISFLSGKK